MSEPTERATPLTDATYAEGYGLRYETQLLAMRDRARDLEFRLAEQTERAEKAERELQKEEQQMQLVEDAIPAEFEGSEEPLGRMVEIIVADRDHLRAENAALKVQVEEQNQKRHHANERSIRFESERDVALTQAAQSAAQLESMRGALEKIIGASSGDDRIGMASSYNLRPCPSSPHRPPSRGETGAIPMSLELSKYDTPRMDRAMLLGDISTLKQGKILEQENAALREALNGTVKSAHPHFQDNPSMFKAWQFARAVLEATKKERE